MCGIALIFGYGLDAPRVDCDELLRIRDAMKRRGPDDAGVWLREDCGIGLAHRRLSIIDPGVGGHQPMATADGRLRVIFNGEIYNYQELRQRLEKKGYQFRSRSDTEVLLHLYAEKGRDMVRDLRGMFAFALWDNHKKGVLLARDPLGIKPLYYADNGRTLRAASQVKALLNSGAIDQQPDPAGHVGFFLWGHVPEPYTLYKGIRALGAGKTLWVDEAGVREEQQFFSLTDEFAYCDAQTGAFDYDDIQQQLAAVLRDSVSHHLIADVPIGVFLSSGLDSATLVALASECRAKDINTVTLGFREYKGTAHDEVPLAEEIAGHYGTRQHTVWVGQRDFKDELGKLVNAMDQPSIDGVNTYFVSKAAAATGLKVALSGIGGDEIFAGYPGFQQIPRMVKGLSLFRYAPVLGKGFRWVSAPLIKHFTSPKYAGLLEYGGSYSGAYLLRRGLFMPWELPDILDEEMVRDGWRELQPLVRLQETIDGVSTARLKVSALELSWYMRNQLLRDADWAGMAHGLEIRTPLVDAELLRSLIPLFMSEQPPTKKDMASTSRKALPEGVLNRRKTGFSVPVHEWLHCEESAVNMRGLRGWAKIILSDYHKGAHISPC